MTSGDARLAQALEWMVRLPLCGEPELAGLVGVDEHDARRLIHELALRGWVESVEAGSPELELRRLVFAREEAAPALAAALGLDPEQIAAAVPVRRRDTLERVARVEITAGVNRLLSGLAAHVRRSGLAELTEGRSLPLAVRAAQRWWLPGVHGYGCLRAGALHAPFLLAWDRAAAPDVYRRRRVAAWAAASAAIARRWGADGLPPTLVVCPTLRELRGWEEAFSRLEGRGGPCVEVLLTTREAVSTAGTGGAVWRRPGRSESVPLVELLGWGTPPAVDAVRLAGAFDNFVPPARAAARSLRAWAVTQAGAGSYGPAWQRLGVLALATGAAEKRLIEWVARHPLLTAAELAALLDDPAALVKRRLQWLTRCGAIRRAPDGHEDGRDDQVNDAEETRYVLTELGMRFLAAQAGVPAATFARHGGVTAVGEEDSGHRRQLRHREHAIGVNRFVSRLADDARRAGWTLAEWRNEAESTHRFVTEDGHASWIRPDGSGVLVRGAESWPFLLEYDRGTLDSGDYRAKFQAYRRYYGGREWDGHYTSQPVVLFVCADDRAEERVARMAIANAPELPVLLTSERRYLAGHGAAMDGWTWAAAGQPLRDRAGLLSKGSLLSFPNRPD